jgi:hypothetical protein
MGVSCPADGSCVATGYYFIDALAGVASGVILVENDDGTWSAAPAPLPPTGTSGGPRRHRAAAAAATGGASGAAVSLGDVSCGSDGFCTALGTDDSANFLETGQVSVPSVSGVAPAEGPLAGGTTVTVSGANFTPTTTVSFGATAAASTTFVDADEIQAVSPSEGYGAVDVTVASGGLISRADDADGFTFEAPTAQPTTTAVTASDTPIVTGEPVTYTITVDPAPAGGTVSLTDGFGLIGSCDDLTLVSGIASCGVTYASTLARASTDDPFPVVARYSGDADDQPSGAVLSEVLEAGGPVITTTVLPGGTRGARYRARLTADGGRGPLHWKVIAGQLPTGTWLSRSGRVRGKPRTTGTFTFTVQVADSARPHRTATAGLTISISG